MKGPSGSLSPVLHAPAVTLALGGQAAVVFLPMDLAHPGGAIFAALDRTHAMTALLAVVLMALGLAAIVLRSEGDGVSSSPVAHS